MQKLQLRIFVSSLIQMNHKRIPKRWFNIDTVVLTHQWEDNTMKKTLLAVVLSQIIYLPAQASELWQQTTQNRSSELKQLARYHLASSQLQAKLMAPSQEVDVELPLPSGEFVLFRLKPNKVMSDTLAEKFPDIKTFVGFQVDNPANTGRFDIGPKGFFGVFNQGQSRVFIDPEQSEHVYRSYEAKALHISKLIKQGAPIKRLQSSQLKREQIQSSETQAEDSALPNTHITYRIAFTTTGEYSQFHGGTKEKVMAAIVTMVNRLNDVYERDLAMSFEIVSDNDKLIFLDPETDPFANTDEDIDILTEQINGLISQDSYDIGHLVGTGGGGLAGFEVVCTEFKAEGVTGSEAPTNDAFHIDYVAHEIGHQLGADHTYNGLAGACDGNRVDHSAYEPGSGSTIMGYTGICDEQDLQANSDPYFHIRSLDQMNNYSRLGAGNTCGVHKQRTNAKPSVEAGQNYTIPAKTAFKLVGSAQDSDGDTLNYSWQQFNLGPASADKQQDSVDDGKRPLFRTFNPSSEPTRVVPQMSDLLKGELSYGEAYATTTRALDFRLVVRDGQGGVSDDTMQVNVVEVEQGFSVTLPDQSSNWRDNEQVVTWHTAGTENAPVSCEKVDILLSDDAGQSFTTTLAQGVANNGQFNVQLDNITTTQARIKVMCSDNIFFAVNSGNFAIEVGEGPITEVAPQITGQVALSVNEDSSITLKTSDLTYATAKPVDKLTLQPGENYALDSLTITPTADFNGSLKVPVTASRGELTSEVFQLTITVAAVNDAPVAQNDTFEVDFEASEVTLDVLSNDSDKDLDTLVVESVDYQGQGTVEIKEGKLVYSAASGFSGKETFNYTVSDGSGGTSTAQVEVTVKEDPTPVTPPTPEPSNDDGGSGTFGLWSLLGLSALFLRRVRK
ncbi:hypothetical protein MTsN2n4_22210 [Pseudoalteromonas sp. MTN2-4]